VGYLTRTVQYTRAVLRRALNQAVKWGLVPRNVTGVVDPPKGERKEREFLSPDEVRTFLGALAGHRLEPLFVTAIALGLRKGKLLALRWRDGDLAGGKLSVRGTMQVIEGKPVVMDTKTKESRRTIALPAMVARALSKQKVMQVDARLRAGMRWRQTEYVFTSTVGTPLGGRNLSTALDKILAGAGLPHIRFHDLRHLAASILLDGKRVRLKDVSALLGHSNTVVTQTIYEHLLDNSGRAVADEMDRFFGTS
jgi:integrase